jgi:hypothetical protein
MSPQRNWKYLAFIRSLPCAVCGTNRYIEAAHTGSRGLGQKSSDFSAIPLCVEDHRTGPCSYHRLGPRKFAEVHRLDIPALVAQFNSVGLRGLIQHAFAKRELSPCFTRFHCFCGFRTAWYRMELDARAALHHHIERREVAA